jgi:hypothetical protein
MNETHFKRFVMIIRSAGFVDSSLIGSQNALNFAYIVYLTLRELKAPDADIEQMVRKWFVFSVLTGRYSSSPESSFDYDIRQIHAQGFVPFAESLYAGQLSDDFWSASLPQEMDTSVSSSPYFRVFQAAQIKVLDRGFLSRDSSIRELIEVKSDVHHVFPRAFLKKQGLNRGQYNQIANYVVAQSEINIAIGSREPKRYFGELMDQCNGGKKKYGNITDIDEMRMNLAMNCIPDGVENMDVEHYPDFLAMRRKLMSRRYKHTLRASEGGIAMQLPVRHLSVRVPWHDRCWNGQVCKDPKGNASCMYLPRLQSKNTEYEEKHRDAWLHELEEFPPCLDEKVNFLSPHSIVTKRFHPYSEFEDHYKHYIESHLEIHGYSFSVIPYGWMLKDKETKKNEMAEALGLSYDPAKEPNLAFLDQWVQHIATRRYSWIPLQAPIKPQNSLIFIYAKNIPLIDGIDRVLIGVTTVTSVVN